MAIDAERPFMRQLPNMPKRRIITDLDTESSGFKNAASLNSTARRLQTSDIDKYNAVQLEAAVKGQDFINQAKEQSNKALQLQREQLPQQQLPEKSRQLLHHLLRHHKVQFIDLAM